MVTTGSQHRAEQQQQQQEQEQQNPAPVERRLERVVLEPFDGPDGLVAQLDFDLEIMQEERGDLITEDNFNQYFAAVQHAAARLKDRAVGWSNAVRQYNACRDALLAPIHGRVLETMKLLLQCVSVAFTAFALYESQLRASPSIFDIEREYDDHIDLLRECHTRLERAMNAQRAQQ